jgi:putative membrane protein
MVMNKQYLLSKDELKRIEDAIRLAEKKTAAEIVPMIVSRSSSVGHVPLFLFVIFLLVTWTVVPYVAPLVPTVPLWLLEFMGLGLAGLLARAQCEWGFWHRRLVHRDDQIASVMRRAQLEFYQSKIKATEKRTGVLLFVSLLERRAVVLADEAVSSQFAPETWDQILGGLIDQVKAGDLAGGFVYAIARLGDQLTEKFPGGEKTVNELPDALIIKD